MFRFNGTRGSPRSIAIDTFESTVWTIALSSAATSSTLQALFARF